jgi:hypothetical protein
LTRAPSRADRNASPELLPAEEFGHALYLFPSESQSGNDADAAGHAPSSREERVDNTRSPAPCRRSVDAALTPQSRHGRKGSGLNRGMDFTDKGGPVAAPFEVLNTVWGPDRFVGRFTSHFWLRAGGACLERAAYSLHRARGNTKLFGDLPHPRPARGRQGLLDPFF